MHDLDNGVIGIPYFGQTGEKLFVRCRNPPGTEPRFLHPKGINLLPYGLNRLDVAQREARLLLCEGESDTLTMWHADFAALGLPGASATRALQLDHVEGLAHVYLLPDNDPAGEQFVEGVVHRLSELGFTGRLWRITVPKEHKDVSDWYVALGVHNFRAALKDAVAIAEELHLKARRPSRNAVADVAPPAGAGMNSGEAKTKKSTSSRLVELAVESGAELFHDAEHKAFAAIPAGDHVETLAVRGAAFKRWLSWLLHVTDGRAPDSQAAQDAITVLEGMACFEGVEQTVHVRLAEHGDKNYLDLTDKNWRVVEVDAAGWRIANGTPVRFRCPKGLLPLPLPEHGGRLDDLRQFINVADDADWRR